MPTDTETKWQTRARHDADELRRLADRISLLRYTPMTADSFGWEYVHITDKMHRLYDEMWEAAMAAWAGDLWPSD
jgi:hypothetical protein